MFLVTNPKIAGFIPEWSEFRGFSILFDNPGDRLLPLDDQDNLNMLSCDLKSEKLKLYKSLNQTFSQFPEMSGTYLFCPLPFHSYHVTLWDGINDANVQNILPEYRSEAGDLLQELPGSLLKKSEFLEIENRPLSISMEGSVEFEFDKLAKWGNSVLVARLKPSDSRSEKILKKIEVKRQGLINVYRERTGLQTCSLSYSPHVSLGYFANKEKAELASPMIEKWNDQFESSTEGLTITFSSNSLYGFNNMTTFFRR